MITAIIITKNEAEHIARCLASLHWVDEIIVLDSGSTDTTVEICKTYTAQVVQTDWPGFGLQKQRALELAHGDWIISLDADEYISAELQLEISEVLANPKYDAYLIPRLSSYCGKQIHHCGWWPDHVLRLFKREQGRFTPHVVHETVQVSGSVGTLVHPILHEAFVNFEEVLFKVNSYSSLGAEMLYSKGERASVSKALLKGVWSFFKTYILRLGWLDGQRGLLLAISNAEGTYYKYLKLWYLQQR